MKTSNNNQGIVSSSFLRLKLFRTSVLFKIKPNPIAKNNKEYGTIHAGYRVKISPPRHWKNAKEKIEEIQSELVLRK